VGELVHRGATVAMGYWRDPDGSARVFRPHPFDNARNGHSEVVVYSGDLVKTDTDGYLYYIARRDQMIKSRGFRISPDEIEASIFSSGVVAHVVAFAVPRNDIDQDIVVAVVPRDPSGFDQEQLRQFCKREMPEYMHPGDIWCLNQLPLTTSGKPDRPAIRASYLDTHQSSSVVARAARTA
jgi:acyl-CoA synthetase (AMP-forming)/AMP-acid ligase II